MRHAPWIPLVFMNRNCRLWKGESDIVCVFYESYERLLAEVGCLFLLAIPLFSPLPLGRGNSSQLLCFPSHDELRA